MRIAYCHNCDAYVEVIAAGEWQCGHRAFPDSEQAAEAVIASQLKCILDFLLSK